MSNPAQGYKLPESAAGSGNTGLSGMNTNQAAYANPRTDNQPTVQEEMGQSLGGNFSLGNTKAESKGEENTIPNPERNDPTLSTAGRGGDVVREQLTAHDIDLPEHAPGQHIRPNDGGGPVHSSTTAKPQV